jgi:hypothetical protein
MQTKCRSFSRIPFYAIIAGIALAGFASPGENGTNAGASMTYYAPLCSQDKTSFTEEDSIDLSDFIKNGSAVDEQGERFARTVRCGVTYQFIDQTPDTITMQAIVSLYNLAKRQVHVRGYLTGVKIILGLNGNKVRYYYQPLYMVYSHNTERYAVIATSDHVYDYDKLAGTFELAASEWRNDVANYEANIWIDHFNKGEFSRLRYDEDGGWKGDTRSIIFSFQEIFEMYHLNHSGEAAGGFYCGKIFLFNGAASYHRTSSGFLVRSRIKHTIYMKSDGGSETLVAGPNNKAANLAHLCPPSCEGLYY